MNGRGRPEKLTDDLKRWITQQQSGHKKKLKAPAIRNGMRLYVEEQVRKDAKDRELDWSEDLILAEVEECLPGVSAIQKYLQDLNSRLDKPLPEDSPWHLHQTLDMPAEAIAHVLEVQKVIPKWMVLPPSLSKPNPESYVIYEGVKLTAIPRCITAREAKWVARLYAIKSLKNTHTLAKAVIVYSLLERLSELSDTSLDTSEADEIITSNKNIENALDCYFSQLSPETWHELVKDWASIQENITKRSEK